MKKVSNENSKENPKNALLITAESFKRLGTWKFDSAGTFGSTLKGMQEGQPADTEPAVADFDIENAGKYRIWVHARDYKSNQQGARFFNVALNGKQLDTTFGKHGENGFLWTDGGVYDLSAGKNEIALIDSSGFFARCDGILITSDIEMIPSEKYEDIIAVAAPVDALKNVPYPQFPEWAREKCKTEKEDSIENEYAKVVFAKVDSKENGSFVQNEIYVKDNGEWLKVKDRTDEHGYLMLKALSSKNAGFTDGFGIFQQVFKLEDEVIECI